MRSFLATTHLNPEISKNGIGTSGTSLKVIPLIIKQLVEASLTNIIKINFMNVALVTQHF